MQVKSSHKRAPPTFIDDALTKIRNREAKLQQKDAIDKSCETEIDAEKHSPCHPLDTSVKGNYLLHLYVLPKKDQKYFYEKYLKTSLSLIKGADSKLYTF